MTVVLGRVSNVWLEDAGDELEVAVSAGSTVLFLEDAFDFEATGGTLKIGDETVTYLSVDYDNNSLLLAAPLAASYPISEEVWVVPYGTSKLATVETEEGVDPPRVLIPYAMSAQFADGVRDPADQENVMISDEITGRWEVVAVEDEVPNISSEYVPTPEFPDFPDPFEPEDPPAVTPEIAVTGATNSLVVRVLGEPHQTTSFRFFISTNPNFTPGPTSQIFETRATVAVITSLQDGSPLVPETEYYVKIQAFNSAGSSTDYSETQSATLDLDVLSTLIAAEVVAGFILTGKIQVGQAYIDANEGIVIPQPDGGSIRFPVNGSFATITAHMIARSLNVVDGLTISGQRNSLLGWLEVSAGVNDPVQAPYPSPSYWNFHADALTDLGSTTRGMIEDFQDSNAYLIPLSFFGANLTKVMKSDGRSGFNKTFATPVNNFHPHGGVATALVSGVRCIYMLGQDFSGTRNGAWYLKRFTCNANGDQITLNAELGIASAGGFPTRPSLGWDHSNGQLMIAYATGERRLMIQYRDSGLSLLDTHEVLSGMGSAYPLSAVMAGTFDYGTYRVIVATENGPILQFSKSGSVYTRLQDQEFERPNGALCAGLAWCPSESAFRFLEKTGRIWHYGKERLSTTVYLQHAWYDPSTIDQTHETMPSDIAILTLKPRQTLRVETPPPPDDNNLDPANNNKANAIRIYGRKAGGTMRLQATWSKTPRNVTGVKTAVNSNILETYFKGAFTTSDIGAGITGPGIPAGAIIEEILNEGRNVALSAPLSAASNYGATVSVTPIVCTRYGLFDPFAFSTSAKVPEISNSFLGLPGMNVGSIMSAGMRPAGSRVWRFDGSGQGRIGDGFFDDTGRYLESPKMPGEIFMWPASGAVPPDCEECLGQAVSRPISQGGTSDKYKRVFDLIGTSHGAGNGSSTFNLPGRAGAFPMSPDGTYPIGSKGGDRTITVANLPSHSHSMNHNHTINARDAAGSQVGPVAGAGGATTIRENTAPNAYQGNTGSAGSGQDYVQPFFTVRFLIKL